MIEIALHKNHLKFNYDSINYTDDRYVIQTDGVFLGISINRKNALAKYIISEYQSKGETFAKNLRGSFLVYIYDKIAEKHLVYTNQIGDKRVYYYHHQGITLISTSIEHITSTLTQQRISYSLDHHAAYYMLAFGYMYGDRTLISEVKRLRPGHMIRMNKDEFETKAYHTLNNKPNERLTEQDALEQIDVHFRNAISIEFEKDYAYGYTPLVSLSGGLDSRMTTWVGHEMGYTNMTNFTFSREGSMDMTIPKQIIQNLNHNWIFQSLDNASYMCNVEKITQLTGGGTSFLPLSHGKYAIDEVDFHKLGILHTGQLGDVTLGSYRRDADYGKPEFGRISSNHLTQKLPVDDLHGYDNREIQLFLNRGFNFILSGNIPVQQYSEVTSPFLDIDFLEFSLTLPLALRVNHRIYKKWIIQKYPGAAEFVWEKTGIRISSKTLTIRGKEIAYSNIPKFVVQGVKLHLGRSKTGVISKNQGMNPFQYWYNTDSKVNHCIEQYFKENIDLIAEEEIKKDCEDLFTKGNINEKAQALTLLAAIKLYWT